MRKVYEMCIIKVIRINKNICARGEHFSCKYSHLNGSDGLTHTPDLSLRCARG